MDYNIHTYPNFMAVIYELSRTVYDTNSYINNHKETLKVIHDWIANNFYNVCVDVELKFTKGVVNLFLTFNEEEADKYFNLFEHKMNEWFPSAKLIYKEYEETDTVYIHDSLFEM